MSDLGVSFTLLLGVLVASLAGSVHCAAMCGPFVLVYSAGEPNGSSKGRWWSHLAYHTGRALTYMALGAVAGALGSAVDWAFQAAGLVRVAAFVSGALVILWGVGALVPAFRGASPLTGPLRRSLIKLGTKPRVVRASILGSLTPLLPCGWLYAFVVTAGGTGSLLGGVLLMAAFWLGTVPALLGVGLLSGRLGQFLRPRVPAMTASALVMVGLLAVVSRALRPSPVQAAGAEPAVAGSQTDGSQKDRPQTAGVQAEVPSAGHHCH